MTHFQEEVKEKRSKMEPLKMELIDETSNSSAVSSINGNKRKLKKQVSDPGMPDFFSEESNDASNSGLGERFEGTIATLRTNFLGVYEY